MSSRRFSVIIGYIAIVALLVAPVRATPSINLGNHANYTLSASLHASETCAVDQLQYMLQVCGYGGPPLGAFAFETIYGNGGSCSSAATCDFTPTPLNVTANTRVVWTNNSTTIHTVTSCSTTNFPDNTSCPTMNASSLPSFDSGSGGISKGQTFSFTFPTSGTYYYYCRFHSWMHGQVNVSIEYFLFSSPMSPSLTANLAGNIGWTVKGLSADVANLQVDHKVSLSIAPLPGITYTPLTEQGSFPQTVNLSTRVESPGTATAIIQEVLSSIPAYYYGLGAIAPYGSYSTLSSVLGRATSSEQNQPVYTMWWVNGPLSLGSPVQILTGYSSVTGDETLDLGGSIGTRNAWLATSQFSQSLNATAPAGPAANVAFTLNLLWSYDKKADILLRSSASASATMLSTTKQSVYIGNPCGPSGYCPSYVDVTVTRTVVAVINLALRLADTDAGLNNRMNAASTSPSSPLDAMANLSLLTYGAIGVAAAAVVGAVVYAVRRANVKNNLPAPAPILPS